MVVVGLDTSALQEIQNRQKELLDIIDSLRDQDIGRYVELPQIIVVGDQSSGKSSVLEAISRVRFPSKSGLCTRFATELVLRTAREPSIQVTIKPRPEEPDDVKKKLEEFNNTQFEKADLEDIIKQASGHMGLDDNGGWHRFSKRILRVKVSGPDVPQLTLVDLPGFYHSGDKNQPLAGRQVVNGLVKEYMEQKSSIILAVVSANNLPIMQQVIEEIDGHDEDRHRTLGIITKPDKLDKGSEDEDVYLQLLKNARDSLHYLTHGWHVLRNRAEHEARGFSSRDKTESELFQSDPWDSVPKENKGIASLRDKLSCMLLRHIERSLPRVRKHIEQNIKDRERILRALGEERCNESDWRGYLEKVARRFTGLAEQAVEGSYTDDEFFGDICPGTEPEGDRGQKNLRAHVRRLNRTFVAVMHKKGAKRVIQWRDKADEEPWVSVSVPPELEKLAARYDVNDPVPITQDELEQDIRKWAAVFLGREFPGSYNTKLALKLFESQAKPWESIGTRHIDLVMEAAESFANAALSHVMGDDEKGRNRIVTAFVTPFFQEKRRDLENKLQELLPRYNKTGFSLALEDAFEQRITERAMRLVDRQVETMLDDAAVKVPEPAMRALKNPEFAQVAMNQRYSSIQQFGIERVVDYMVEYYGVSCSEHYADSNTSLSAHGPQLTILFSDPARC